MAKHQISKDLRTFIKEKIQTVLRLEVLLLLHDQRPRAFTAAEVANELGFENETTAKELTVLEKSGLVVQSRTESKTEKFSYRYHPLNATLGSMIEQLARGYSKHRVSILSVMLSAHPDRTRLFAEAFRIIRSNDGTHEL
jgi:predicted transcriptional regulator